MTKETLAKATELDAKRRVANFILTFGITSFIPKDKILAYPPDSFDDDCMDFFKELKAKYEKEIEEL